MPIQVLLIEDNRPDAALVREALKQQGLEVMIHQIEEAEAATTCLRRMGPEADVPCPGIVIMDLNLPRGDGLEILRRIRKNPKCTDVPVIVMTSSDAPNDRAAAAELGNTQFFRKPLELDAFLQIGVLVREILALR